MEEYLTFAVQLSEAAGDIMLEYFQIGIPVELKAAEGNTPVTIADKAINQLVVDRVQKQYPSHAVLGEEQSLDRKDAPYTWVCDPIDGTIPFSKGVPTNVFSLALISNEDGQPQVAVVLDPYLHRQYHAVKGGGAFVNDKRIHVDVTHTLADAIIGITSKRSIVVESTSLKSALIAQTFRQLSFNSTIYEAMLVASGQISAQVFVGSGAHDVAAAKLIVEEAGGCVTDIFGNEQRYDRSVSGALFSNGLVHKDLVQLAKKYKLKR
jgi:fructose-1,6-bisphosphatase/inositol monophosphatase family enzyme